MDNWFFEAWFAFIVGVNVAHYWLSYRRYPSFEEYRRRYPALVRNGHCSCFRCGGRRVFLHNLGPFRRRHVCATCSTVLYRG